MVTTYPMAQRGPNSAKIPMHLLISEKLRIQIMDGVYAAGEQLPSEFDLGATFGVSRTTVRRAIANLISQGLVLPQQGRGVFVKAQHKIKFSLSNPLAFFDVELAQQGVIGKIRNLSFQQIKAPPEVCTALQLAPGTSVYQQQKIILANRAVIAIDIAYYLNEVGEKLAQPLQQGFTYATLDCNGYPLEWANVTLESTHANPEISAHLGIPLGGPLLVYRYVAHTCDRPIVCGQTFSRADRMCYSALLEKKDLKEYSTMPES